MKGAALSPWPSRASWRDLRPGLSVLLAVALLALVLAFRAAKWAFWPRHELPRHRVRHLKMRLFLRLHPGRGHATAL